MFETFAALAEPNRLRIVDLLRGGPQPVGHIGEALGLRQPQVSKHLQVLKGVGLVHMHPEGQQRRYELRGAPLRELHGWLEQYRELWDARFEALDDVIEELKQKELRRASAPRRAKPKQERKKHVRKSK
jgi:DNA-binding transcriptional ArsR family regulator